MATEEEGVEVVGATEGDGDGVEFVPDQSPPAGASPDGFAQQKRPAEGAPEPAEEPPQKEAKVSEDLNPLTGEPYTPRFYQLLERRQRLPAWASREEFLSQMQSKQVVLMVGDAGSGKTTQLPQILLDAGYHVQDSAVKSLACVHPHSLGTLLAAQRVAEELEVPIGTFVGYHIKFDDRTSPDTLLRMVSAEALLREAVADPALSRYSVILMDDAHTRTATIDTLLGLLKRALGARPELKLVLVSPSLEISKLQKYFSGSAILQMPTKNFSIDVHYLTSGPKDDYLRIAVRTVLQIHSKEGEGDVIVFLPTEEDIDAACVQIRRESLRLLEHGELIVLPAHENCTVPQTKKVFEPAPGPKIPGGPSARKVIVATDIGDSTLSIDNIVFVVDSGFTKMQYYNPRTRMEAHHTSAISKATAMRRARTAGRSCPGKVFRLYKEKPLKDMVTASYPEITRTNLTSTVLLLKRLGIEDLDRFEFPDAPPAEALSRAIENLRYLQCLDEDGDVTDFGTMVSQFPVDPQLGRFLVNATQHNCSNEALSIAAMLSVPPVFLRPSGSTRAADEARNRFAHVDGDHLTLLNVLHAYQHQAQEGGDPGKFCGENYLNMRSLTQAEVTREHLRQIMMRMGIPMTSTNFQDKEYYPNIRRCLLSAFFLQVVHLDKPKLGLYLTLQEAEEVSLHPTTCLVNKGEWLIYYQFLQTSRDFVRTVTPVQGEWLLDVVPGYFEDTSRFAREARAPLERLLERRRSGPIGGAAAAAAAAAGGSRPIGGGGAPIGARPVAAPAGGAAS